MIDKITNVDQLRHAIDSGEASDKVNHTDPAVAPLGTDAEAGGASPTKREIAVDAAALTRTARRSRDVPGAVVYAVLVMALGMLILALIYLSTLGSWQRPLERPARVDGTTGSVATYSSFVVCGGLAAADATTSGSTAPI